MRYWNLEAYLYFGYVPSGDWPVHPDWLVEMEQAFENPSRNAPNLQMRGGVQGQSFDEAVDLGIETLDRCFDDAFSGRGENYVVPLSGGLDSRAILGGAVERIPRENIVAITFGQPGLFDYEIAPRIAAAAGVTHKAVDLREVRLDTESLVTFGASLGKPVRLFQAFLHHRLRLEVRAGAVICSGFFGGPPSGGHLPAGAPIPSWKEALAWFCDKNRYCRSIDPGPPGWRPEAWLPDSPACGRDVLSYEDQLDMLIRQERFIRPLVVHDAFSYACPLASRRWIAFFLNQPLAYRKEQRLYREILARRYPKLFRLPTTNFMGLAAQPGMLSRTAVRLKRRMVREIKRIFPRSRISVSPTEKELSDLSGL